MIELGKHVHATRCVIGGERGTVSHVFITIVTFGALPQSKIEYEDYNNIYTFRIGVLREYVRMAHNELYFTEKSLTLVITHYDIQEDLF